MLQADKLVEGKAIIISTLYLDTLRLDSFFILHKVQNLLRLILNEKE